MKIYRVEGWFKKGIFKQKFSKDVLGLSEKHALERIYSDIGSKHKVTRNQINIDKVTEIKPEEVKDPRIFAMLE
ncbi:MAG: 50S ribosomal protein L18Ae [Candidatus Hadarchaeales archaeon]